MSKNLIYVIITALLIILGIFYFWGQTQSMPVGETVVINMSGLDYSNKELNIKVGDVVKFVNSGDNDYWPASNIHPTHSIYPEFDPLEPVPRADSWSFQFKKAGSWRFHDHLHPQIKGVINVD